MPSPSFAILATLRAQIPQRVSTDDLIILPRNRSELPRGSERISVISENQGFIEHPGNCLDRRGGRTGMMESPRHEVSPLRPRYWSRTAPPRSPYSRTVLMGANEAGWT